MRTLFVGALAVTLVGCDCFVSSQAGAEACTSASGCVARFDRTVVGPAARREPRSFDADSATPRTSSGMASDPVVKIHIQQIMRKKLSWN